MTVSLLVGAIVVVGPSASFAVPPRLGADCGAGASIVGNDTAGKVTLGQSPAAICTLWFVAPLTTAPACMAVNESNDGGESVAIGTSTSAQGVVLGGRTPWVAGDVIAYVCVNY